MIDSALPTSGLLLHPQILPGRFGMGELGVEAIRLLHVLGEAQVPAWIVPASALEDVALLSFEQLRDDGALLTSDFERLPPFDERGDPCPGVREVRLAFLVLAARRFLSQIESSPFLGEAYEHFCTANAAWLDDWALQAVLDWHGQGHSPAANAGEALLRYADEIEEHRVLQFLLTRHWMRLARRAAEVGVQLLVDASPRVPLPPGMHPAPEASWLLADTLFGAPTHRFLWADISDAAMLRLVALGPPSSQE